ncbi:MAG: hypothetical protein Ct9H90mP18_04870 [Gammaproteobacteria bacterium]|nr:MAG: hypothetical protein Ct9H90mP18_04870 [Gammaproteobacteria bacterium]
MVKVISGNLKIRDKIKIFSSGNEFVVDKIGVFTPKLEYLDSLEAGEVGFFTASIKSLDAAPIGDTILDIKDTNPLPLPGFEEIKPRVFSGFYPIDSKKLSRVKKSAR